MRLVLRNTPEVRPEQVETQRRVDGASGRHYYADFFLSVEHGPRLVLEVDGYNKAPGARTPQQVKSDGEARSADLLRAGFTVLQFSNDEVTQRSRDAVSKLRAHLQSSARPRPASTDPSAAVWTVTAEAARPEVSSAAINPAARKESLRRAIVISCVVAFVVLGLVAIAAALQLNGDDAIDSASAASDGSCPAEVPVKGNVSQSGERIYHAPGWEYYSRTVAEECFASGEAAEQAGYRASEVQ